MKFAVAFVLATAGAIALSWYVGNRPADCEVVAEQLTSFELGNYAEPEDRAPVIDKHRSACEHHDVTVDEAECLDKTRDARAAARCVPRLFPELAPQ